jgi:hypothetical protein
MSVYMDAARITDKHGQDYCLQVRARRGHGMGDDAENFRAARLNGWHCGHWHRTSEDAVACAIAKGVQA